MPYRAASTTALGGDGQTPLVESATLSGFGDLTDVLDALIE
jgi:hypothetical protein